MERRLNEDLCPTFAVVLQSPEPLNRARWQNAGRGTIEEFQTRMDTYSAANLQPVTQCFMDFFQDCAKIEILNLPVAGKDEEDMFESTRIYMEKDGRPFNYLIWRGRG